MRACRRVPAAWAGVVATLALLTTPLAAANGASTATPQDWVAHSAYGLELSVPKSWAIGYFQNCPIRDAGTLLIGTPAILSNCTNVPSDANVVWMQPQATGARYSGQVRHFVVHGLAVTAYGSGVWVVPSEHVVISAMGPRSAAVLQTLTTATSRAEAAPGMLRGSEYLIALMKTPVTGPVSVMRQGPPRSAAASVQAYDAQFWKTFPPGTYELGGHAGNAPCPPVQVTIQSGRTVYAPEIDCQGE